MNDDALVAVVADDDAVTRRMLTLLLERQGWEVHSASGGEDALRLVGGLHPAILFLDARMPPPDGYEVCSLVRADTSLPRQPRIVMITAGGQDADRERAMDAQVDQFVTKPFSPSRLTALLDECRSEQ